MTDAAKSRPLQVRQCGVEGYGASLDYRANSTYWHPVSFHDRASLAVAAYERLPSYLDRDPGKYRVSTHPESNDLGVSDSGMTGKSD